MHLAVAQDLASRIRRGTSHRRVNDWTGGFAALTESSRENNHFVRTYSSCGAPQNQCVLVQFQFDCDETVCRITPIHLQAAYITPPDYNQTKVDGNTFTAQNSLNGSERKLVGEEAPLLPDGDPPGENLLSLAIRQFCQRLGMKCNANSLPVIGPFIEGFVQSGGAKFLPKISPAKPNDEAAASAQSTVIDSEVDAVAATTEEESAADREVREAADRIAHSNIRSGSITLPSALDDDRRLTGEAGAEKDADFESFGGNPLDSLLRLVEGDVTLSPLTPPDSFKLDNSGMTNPFLSMLPTIRPPPISMRRDDVPFDNWLARVKLPPNVRAATSGMELLRAVESKSLELFLSVARVPIAVTANALNTPSVDLPAAQLPPMLDPIKLNREYDAADLIARLQTQNLLRFPQAPSLPQLGSLPSADSKSLQDVLTASDDVSGAGVELQQFGAVDSIMGLLSPFLPGGGALQPDSVLVDDAYLDDESSQQNPVSTSDLLPWLPMDSVAASLPSWLIESLMGPYALLFQDFVRVAQDGFIRMQLIFDTFADEPIPVTARGIERFSEQMAEAFRATPAGDEADALKSIALTVRQLPTFMPGEEQAREAEGFQQAPLLSLYDDWVEQLTKNRRLDPKDRPVSTSEGRKPDSQPAPLPPKTVVFLSERTTSDNLPWLPMDGVVAGLPSYYLDKLGKPGQALKKVAGAWLSGAEKVDKATKSVLDPILSLTGDSPSDKTSSRDKQDWDTDERSYRHDDSSQRWGHDSSSSSTKKNDGRSSSNILDTVGDLISGLIGQRTNLFLQAEEDMENARLSILEGLNVGPVVLNDAAVSLVSSVPDVLLSLYNPFPESSDNAQRSIEQLVQSLQPPKDTETDTPADLLADLQLELERALQSTTQEIQRLISQLHLPADQKAPESVQSPTTLEGLIQRSALPSLFETQSDLFDVPSPLDSLLRDNGHLLPPSIEEVNESIRVAQESFESALLRLGILPIKLEGQALPTYLVGQQPSAIAFQQTGKQTNISPRDAANTHKETPQTDKETALKGDETSREGDETAPTTDTESSDSEERELLQLSNLPELYDETFSMYERALQEQWRFIREYNRLLYKSNPLASPPENPSPSPSPSPSQRVSPEAQETAPNAWSRYDHYTSPTYSSVDSMAALLGNLLNSLTYTGGEMLGTVAQRFVPSGSEGPKMPRVEPQPVSPVASADAEIEQVTVKLKDALARADQLVAITERLERIIAAMETAKRRLSETETAKASETETAKASETAKAKASETETAKAVGERENTGLWFVKPAGVGEDDNLRPSELLIGLLEAANQANFKLTNQMTVPPLKLSIPPALDMRVKLVDIYKQMEANEAYGNLGLLMNQELKSFAHWALARDLINRNRPTARRLHMDRDETTRRDSKADHTGGDAERETEREGDAERETEREGDADSETHVHLEGLFDTLFDLISGGVSDLKNSAETNLSPKQSAATFIRSISDQIVSSGPKIKEEPEGDAELMDEKQPHRGEKCVNNINCRINRRTDTDQPIGRWRSSGSMPQGSVILNDPYQSRDEVDAYSRRSFYSQ